MTSIDWNKVKSIVLVDENGKTLKTDPEIWCGGYKQWPIDIPVAAPYFVRQTGSISSGRAIFNIGSSTEGIAAFSGYSASDTATHYATFTLADGYCWADGYTSKTRTVSYSLTKYSVSFSLTLGSKKLSLSLTGFNPNASYSWDEAVSSGQLSSSFTVSNYVYYDGIYVHDSSDDYAMGYDAIPASGAYALHTVAVPYATGQTGTFSSGTVTLNVTTGTSGISSISGTSATDTSTHYATVYRDNTVCWADGSTASSRTVSYSLTKYSVSFTITDTENQRYSYTVSSFDSSRQYTWSAAITADAISTTDSEFDVRSGIVYFLSKIVQYNGSNVYATSYIVSGAAYTSYQPKVDQSYTVTIAFNSGVFTPTISGLYVGTPTYRWSLNGVTIATTRDYPVSIRSLSTVGTNTLQLTVAYSGNSSYNSATVTSSKTTINCVSSDAAQAGTYSSTCTARFITINGTSYAAFSISGTPTGSPYTRYSFRQSSSLSESSWGSSTYYRRYYIAPNPSSLVWSTMPYAKYSSGKWVSGGTSSAAWYNVSTSGHLQIWITSSSSKATRYFGLSSGVSVPN